MNEVGEAASAGPPDVDRLARTDRVEQPDRGVWTWAEASRAHAVIDAGPYFELIREAMLAARQRILLIGWDFDTRITFGGGRRWWNRPRRDIPPARLGPFMIWLANRNPDLEIRILKWNFGALKAFFRGRMMLDLIRWYFHPRIVFKLDAAHPLGCSHHQKILVIDDRFAACGGIDVTRNRWDTTQHLEADPRRRNPSGRAYPPWHDGAMLMEGEVAKVLGDYGRTRWREAGGNALEPCAPQAESAWPERLNPAFRDVSIGVSRTCAQYADRVAIHEIEHLFAAQIARAQRFIYAENQYFASRKVAEAIALRLAEPDPPEIVIVTPEKCEGWLQQTAMDTARVRLFHAVKARDHAARFSMWTPYNAAGTAIYVHTKLMIVDDTVLRIGSANMNNRSLGLDTECDVFIDGARPENAGCGAAIVRLRHMLIAEHCGMRFEDVGPALERYGAMAPMIAASSRAGHKQLRPFVARELSEAERALADNEVLDPERPEQMLAFYGRKNLFAGRILRRPHT